MKQEISFPSLFMDPGSSIAYAHLAAYEKPWEALSHITAMIEELAQVLPRGQYEEIASHVWVARSATIAPSAHLGAPCIICVDAEIRHGAFIRGAVIVGSHAVVGNSVELKNCILFDGAQVPHFNYVGDSILGCRAHMGAGAITSNIKGDRSLVTVLMGNERIETGLKKFGALLGDYAEIGCNCVLNPGSIIGRHTQVYPMCAVRGYIPPSSIYKEEGKIVAKRKDS